MSTCQSCGQENPAAARFCNACAAPLQPASAVGREVRKTVTIVFCDVVGSTALGERSDPEVLRAIMGRFYAAVRGPVERHGGTVEKVIGDALVAVFGIPAVHEDDALRAVRAGLEMRDAVRLIGEVETRIGINTGEVLARDPTERESLVVGDAVNVAARLQQAAAPGEVLVGDDTWALVSHAVSGVRLAPLAAKGKRDAIAPWRLDAVDPDASGHRRRLDAPIVGRHAELDVLRWALERAGATRKPHLVIVSGQPGIGKSRLVSELPRLGTALVLVGQCRATVSSSSLDTLFEVARGVVADDESLASSVARIMVGDPDGAAVASCLTEGAVAGAPDIAWAVARLVAAVAAAGPVVVVLEDVHWADRLLLDLVGQLVERGKPRSLLVVCTTRPDVTEEHAGRLTGPNAVSLTLERLDDEETWSLLAHAGPTLTTGQAERVVAAAEGNPLFAEHLAALVGEHDSEDRLPRSIQVLLAARLESLDPGEGEVIAAAAVAGRDFDDAAVTALLDRPIDAELAALTRRDMLEAAAPGRHRFVHALLQEAAYGLLPKRRRSDAHVEIARWLARAGAGDALVADHLERAVLLQRDLEQPDDRHAGIATEAGRLLAAAGRRADAMGEPVRAHGLLQRALALLPRDGPDRAAATVELAAAGWNLHSAEELEQLLRTGAELAAGLGLRAVELRARILQLGLAVHGAAALTPYEELAATNAAIVELESLAAPRPLATALCTRAAIELHLGRAGDALASVNRAIDTLRSAEEDTVWALTIHGRAIVESPTPVAAAEDLIGGLLADLGSRPTVRCELLHGQAMLAVLRGDVDASRSLLEEARRVDHELGRRGAARFARNEARLLLRAGRFEEAAAILRPIAAALEIDPSASDRAVVHGWLASAEVGCGNVDAAARAGLAARLDAQATADYEALILAETALSHVRMVRGETAAAVAHARVAATTAASGDWVILEGNARLALARALGAAGEADAAAAEARAAALIFTRKGACPGLATAEALSRSFRT